MMKMDSSFEIVEISGEYMVVPVGTNSASFNGIVALNEASACLLRHLETSKSKRELIELLISTYDIGYEKAAQDIESFIAKLSSVGVITSD